MFTDIFTDVFTAIIQLYYMPIVLAVVLIVVIVKDTLLQPEEKVHFLWCIAIIFVIMLAVIADNTIRAYGEGDLLVSIRRITSAIQYGLSPFVPICILLTYASSLNLNLPRFIFIPAFLNTVLAFVSINTGWIFVITSDNGYIRGPVHIIPFIVSTIYFLICAGFAFKNKAIGRVNEKYTLIGLSLFIDGAYAFEIILGRAHLLWPTCIVAMVIYYMTRQMDVFQYDPLTGAKNRHQYEDFVTKCKNSQDATFAFIDMNNLKVMNDMQGHDTGDQALIVLSKGLSSIKLHKSNVYRIGGDEFVIAGLGNFADELESKLNELRNKIGSVNNNRISFAHAVMDYKKEMDIGAFLKELDEKMYVDKKEVKVM